MSLLDTFEARQIEAEVRISQLRQSLKGKLDALPQDDRFPSLTIYATGSLARKEANSESDLDAFFMLSSNHTTHPMGRIRDVRVLNAVLDSAEETNFPDFSNDGEYLKFLHIDHVIEHLGDREDDYINAFTARMLMLLESTYLYNEDKFNEFRNKIIDVYFTDFHRHSDSFRPIFLLNDVIRFWRTLCLNYENGRHWRMRQEEGEVAKGHLQNLKLKFSRLSICYSFICHLLSQGPALAIESVIKTASLTPFERLAEIADRVPECTPIILEMREEYAWFLDATSRPKDVTLDWILNQANRDDAFSHAGRFVNATVNLTTIVANKHDYLRYLIV